MVIVLLAIIFLIYAYIILKFGMYASFAIVGIMAAVFANSIFAVMGVESVVRIIINIVVFFSATILAMKFFTLSFWKAQNKWPHHRKAIFYAEYIIVCIAPFYVGCVITIELYNELEQNANIVTVLISGIVMAALAARKYSQHKSIIY